MEVLSLHDNDLTGSIPAELGQLSSLRTFYLQNNGLTDRIPAELGQLDSLRHLYLSSNRLTGSIPAELGQLGSLEVLYLHENRLTGVIPTELGQLASLRGLALNINNLTGVIPAELGRLGSLEGIWLNSNELTGPIPPVLSRLTSLERLYLHDNELTGPVPPELGNLTRLYHLLLFDNRLTGEIPGDFLQLGSLDWFDFYDNDGLCAPSTSAFTSWLGGIAHWNGPRCGGAIFGRVRIEAVGLDGVTVSLSNGASTTTSGGGNYRFDNVAAGTFTVTISGYSDDYSFSETSQTVTISAGESAEVNFVGVLTRTSGIAGRVRADGQGLSAVTVTLSGTESRSITTGDDGQYGFAGLAAGDYSVSISGYDADAYEFEVTSRDVTVAQDEHVIVNFEGRVRGDDYKVLTGLTITASGAVKWGNLTNSGCIGATRITISGATYEVHWTEWQRSTSGSAWSQVAGTRKTRQICGYNLSNAAAGTYRWVGELTPAGGSRAKYKSENEVTVGGGGSNRSPVTVGTIPSATVQAGESTSVNASSYFSDPDGDALTYTASSSRASVATASVSGRTVTVNGVAAGSATIRITATDPGGLSATQTFSVTVEAGSGGDFEAFSGLRINNDGSVRLQVGGITLSAGRTGCISGGGTLNGKVYDYHWTAWQRDTGSGWTEVSGSKQSGKLCGYDLTSAPSGKYRLVGDMTLAGTRGSYKSENEVTK